VQGSAPAVTDGNQPVYFLIDSTVNFLIASNHADSSGRDYSVYAINSTTAVLTEVQGSPFTIGQNTGPQTFLQIDSSGQHLLIVGESLNSIFVDKIDPTSGAITQGNMTALPTMAGTRFTALVPLQ